MAKYICKVCNIGFENEEYNLTNDNSKCILHCKKNTWCTIISGKKEWDNKKVSLFWIEVRKRIINYRYSDAWKEGFFLNLGKSIFPIFEDKNIDYDVNRLGIVENSTWHHNFFDKSSNENDDYSLDISIDFDGSIFLDNADFDNYKCRNTILFENVIFEGEISFYNSSFEKISFNNSIFNSVAYFFDCTLSLIRDKHFNNTIFNDNVQFDNVNFGVKNSDESTKNQVFLLHTEFYGRVHFNNCNFFNKLTIEDVKNTDFITIDNSSFKNLRINSELNKLNIFCREDKKVIHNLNISNKKIDKLLIKNYTIKKRFIFNNINKINNISFSELIFNEKVEMKNCNINNLVLLNTSFTKTVDFFQTLFNITNFNKTNFEEVVVFENTIFNEDVDFKFTSFSKLGMFKKAIFKKSLNLEDSIIQGEMNFLKVYTNVKNRETARIIKYQFEKIGNKIEANKYHTLELEQKRIELEKDKSSDWKEKLIFDVHNLSSNHSTNWFRALILIFFIGCLTILFVHFGIVKDLFFNPSNFKIDYIFKAWNELWQFIYIGYMDDKLKDNSLTFLFNKISLGYLYYQFLISVRKDTRK